MRSNKKYYVPFLYDDDGKPTLYIQIFDDPLTSEDLDYFKNMLEESKLAGKPSIIITAADPDAGETFNYPLEDLIEILEEYLT